MAGGNSQPLPLDTIMKKSQRIIILLLVLFMAGFLLLDLGQYLQLDYLKQQQHLIAEFYRANTLLTLLLYFILYVLITGLSLPGAAILTLAGGAVFGLLWGTIIVSFASTIGAMLAFLIARYLFRETVQRRFAEKLIVINKGIEEEGAWYLFTLRLVPLFPFFIINLLMGLTTMRLPVYFLISQIGMLAGTIVYVNAGTQLAKINSTADILSFELLVAFVLLGLFPLLANRLAGALRKHLRAKHHGDAQT